MHLLGRDLLLAHPRLGLVLPAVLADILALMPIPPLAAVLLALVNIIAGLGLAEAFRPPTLCLHDVHREPMGRVLADTLLERGELLLVCHMKPM